MENKNRLILITWVSGSGKTTLQNELLSRGWKKPINFTTRKPRTQEVYEVSADGDYTSNETEEYVFLDRKTFVTKLLNWDFLEMTMSYWNFYGVSRFLPEGKTCIVVDPVGRAQIMENFIRRWYTIETYYMECSEQLQFERLTKRGDYEKDILLRKNDFKWYSPTNRCIRLSGKKDPSELADFIENNYEWKV